MPIIKCVAGLLTCLVLIEQARTQDVSEGLLNFLSIVSGVRSNRQQLKGNESLHDSIQMRFVPVIVPVLGSAPVVLFEKDVNDKIISLILGVVEEDSDKSFIMKTYTFTDKTKYKPMTFNISDLSNLTLSDLKEEQDCPKIYVPIGRRVMAGMITSCSSLTATGSRPVLSSIHGCAKTVNIVPDGVPEKAASKPYILLREESFPIPGAPKDFVSICDKKEEK